MSLAEWLRERAKRTELGMKAGVLTRIQGVSGDEYVSIDSARTLCNLAPEIEALVEAAGETHGPNISRDCPICKAMTAIEAAARREGWEGCDDRTMQEAEALLALESQATPGPGSPEWQIEENKLAAEVHDRYLETVRHYHWPVRAEVNVPFDQLSIGAKALDLMIAKWHMEQLRKATASYSAVIRALMERVGYAEEELRLRAESDQRFQDDTLAMQIRLEARIASLEAKLNDATDPKAEPWIDDLSRRDWKLSTPRYELPK